MQWNFKPLGQMEDTKSFWTGKEEFTHKGPGSLCTSHFPSVTTEATRQWSTSQSLHLEFHTQPSYQLNLKADRDKTLGVWFFPCLKILEDKLSHPPNKELNQGKMGHGVQPKKEVMGTSGWC